MVYLDHAATTPVPQAVADVMYRVLTEAFGNPSSQYPLGRDAAALVDFRTSLMYLLKTSYLLLLYNVHIFQK